jgi:hypothetical protein
MSTCGMCHLENCDCEMRFGVSTRPRDGLPDPPRLPEVVDGPYLWMLIHSHEEDGQGWFEEKWVPLLRYLGCDCKNGFAKIRETWKPDFSSPDAFFRSGIELHNAVNRKLGKPELTLDEAYRIWRPNKE